MTLNFLSKLCFYLLGIPALLWILSGCENPTPPPDKVTKTDCPVPCVKINSDLIPSVKPGDPIVLSSFSNKQQAECEWSADACKEKIIGSDCDSFSFTVPDSCIDGELVRVRLDMTSICTPNKKSHDEIVYLVDALNAVQVIPDLVKNQYGFPEGDWGNLTRLDDGTQELILKPKKFGKTTWGGYCWVFPETDGLRRKELVVDFTYIDADGLIQFKLENQDGRELTLREIKPSEGPHQEIIPLSGYPSVRKNFSKFCLVADRKQGIKKATFWIKSVLVR